ncbi:hypothetical protein HRE53_22245 [Acaryochloris sp. 'Moss Beach']|uniref:DUF6756 family protein n=1 Tax=Acaryochloris sp. 'Moss Beach' TaxID=2740837 RepID=UPI001F3315A2|nr:DUF6756 family protein [Acaryochloris sp. 'Moss Beach']UJB69096.1 hypothetical protein HRE53_22245 [Acaryochloris sp. 'Moss Beach']
MAKRKDFRLDIEQAVNRLNISVEDFKAFGIYECEDILINILNKFTVLGKQGIYEKWLWNSFKGECFSIHPEYVPKILRELILIA